MNSQDYYKKTYLECDCTEFEHCIRMSYDDDVDMMYVHYFLPKAVWWKRLWTGIKYIFGHRSKFGDFGETCWTRHHVKQFVDFGQQFLDDDERKG